MKKIIRTGMAVIVLLIAGCGVDDAQRDLDEERDPHVRRALEQIHVQNWDRAVRHLENALANNPGMGRPHLELALIYHQRKNDLIRAIYHYERYLERRPDTEKRTLVNDWIRQARISLAGEIGRTAGDITEELVRLRRENTVLRQRLAAFEGSRAPAQQVTTVRALGEEGAPQPPASPTAADEDPAPAVTEVAAEPVEEPPAVATRTYTVVAGDTLMGIARRVYNDPHRWRAIYEANRAQMKHEADLKVGQQLVIP